MLAVFFRLINDDGPTGKTGLAVGNSYHEIFLAIDEVGDPYYCEIAKLPRKKEVIGHMYHGLKKKNQALWMMKAFLRPQ